jgi:hypothetical protein
MSDWYCFTDKVKMEKCDVLLNYMVVNQFVPGLKCPKCGTQYITEEVAMTVVQAAENALEEK